MLRFKLPTYASPGTVLEEDWEEGQPRHRRWVLICVELDSSV